MFCATTEPDNSKTARRRALTGPPGELPIVAKWQSPSLAGAGELRAEGNVAAFDPPANPSAFGNSQVVVILKIQPELGGQAEILSQANGSIGTDSPVSADDFIDAGK